MSLFEPLTELTPGGLARLIRPGQVTPLLDEPFPGWYLDRDGVVLGVNLLACQVWGADRPGDLLGESIFTIFARALSHHLPVVGNEAMLAAHLALLASLRDRGSDRTPGLLGPYQAFERIVAEHLAPDRGLHAAHQRDEIAALWSHRVRLRVHADGGTTRFARLAGRLRLLEGDWGAIVTFAPDDWDSSTADLFSIWYKRAIRLWGARSFVQYDARRFGEYAFVLKEVGLTRHRDRRDEATPQAVAALVRSALDGPGLPWKCAAHVSRVTGLPLDLVAETLHSLADFGTDVVPLRLPTVGAGRRVSMQDYFVSTAPRWHALAHRLSRCLAGLGRGFG
jgi:hypothetical protein